MASSNSIGKRIINNVAGETAQLLVDNTSNTAGADAILNNSTASGGGAYHEFAITGQNSWFAGINTSNNYYVASSTNTAWEVYSDYNTKRPNTDAFSASLAGNTAACTGDGTVYVIGSDISGTPYPYGTPSINTRGSFNKDTGVFTASRTGIYLISGTIRLGSVGTAMTTGTMDFLVNASPFYRFGIFSGATRSSLGTDLIFSNSLCIPLTVNDTVVMRAQLSNSTLSAIIVASGTSFNGVLLK